MRHLKFNKMICGLLICSIILASGLIVFANNDNQLIDTMKSATLVRREPTPTVIHRHGDFKAAIEQLVEEGKLSREKAAQIDKYLQQKREEQNPQKGHKYGLIKDLVNAKIINDAEADAIRNRFREIKQKNIDEKLGVLVQKGTITQAQADKVKAYIEAARKEKAEQFKKLQNMNEEQRKAFFKEHKKDNFMNKLVEDGVLTREQVEEIRKIFIEMRKNKES